MCRAKYPLQAVVFGLQVEKGSPIRFQAGRIGLQRMQATSDEGQTGMNTGWRMVNVKDATESTEGEQEVMGMGAGKGASLCAALEIVFFPRNKFKEPRFQELAESLYPLPCQRANVYRTLKPPQGGFLEISESTSPLFVRFPGKRARP
jgi:hypothetical protein